MLLRVAADILPTVVLLSGGFSERNTLHGALFMEGGPRLQFLVVYAQDPSGALRTELERIMGLRLVPGVLPCEAGPFGEDEAAELEVRLEAAPGYLGPFGGGFFMEPPVEEVEALPHEEAERIARTVVGSRAEFAWVGAFELPRCWAFLFYQGPYIPPGTSVIVDKHTRTPMRMRYVDVQYELSELGFDINPGEGRSISHLPKNPPPKRRLTDNWERGEDSLTKDADGTLIPVEVWTDPVTGLRCEIDRAGKRIRVHQESGDNPWRPLDE